ncbi:acyltransferase [Acidiphilium acidophilum]|uniref:acyltransferase family protein n=1 Tax=Acidiphilium acidophilum TaxID=76588 RepID=UPI002E8E7784|nr:acyltransferase [Acidiphilium acidophilum]
MAIREIKPLTGLRGVAAISVVALHVSGSLNSHKLWATHDFLLKNLIAGGDFAVDIFFMLSGFVLMINYMNLESKTKFFVYRFARIFPLNTFVLSMMAFGVFILEKSGFHFSQQDYSYFKFKYLPYHFLLIFVWLGMPIAWNGPAWSLSAETFAYCFFPAIRWLLRNLKHVQIAVILVILIILQTSNLVLMGFEVTGADALLRACLGFFVGAGISLININVEKQFYLPDLFALSILILICAGFPELAVFPAAMLIHVLRSPGASIIHKTLGSNNIVRLGRWSYSIYLLHAPLLIGSLIVLRHLHSFQSGWRLGLFFAFYALLVVISSAFSYRLVENPSRYYLQNVWKRMNRAERRASHEVG